MKQIISLVLCLFLSLSLSFTAFASDGKPTDNKETAQNPLSITVVVPSSNVEQKKEAPKLNLPYLYPVSVWETEENGQNEIIKTYELGKGEKPEHISKEAFKRGNILFELTDITKSDAASYDTKNHAKTVTVDTNTNDLESVIKLLAPTVEHTSDDGYIGVLALDVSSIKIKTAGSKKSSYTVSAKREYPHLSSNDPSLVPKTISENGRTLNLSGVTWKTQTTETVDYDQLPSSYTAVATYTTTGSKTVITGYVTTAEYSGEISKIITGKTVYTAYFLGVPIVSPTLTATEYVDMGFVEEIAEIPKEEKEMIETVETQASISDIETDKGKISEISEPKDKIKPFDITTVVVIVLIIEGIIGGFIYFFTSKKKKGGIENEERFEEENEDDEKTEDAEEII